MDGEDDLERVRDAFQLHEGVCQQRPVDEARPVQRDDEVRAAHQAASFRRTSRVDPLPHRDQRVDHRVADVVDRLCGAAFREQVVARLRRVDEQELRDLVGDDPVDLLRHCPVERAQSRLDVPDRELQLGGRQRRSKRRVHVAGDEHDVRLGLDQHRLEPLHHARRLLRVRPRADAQ
jgi:hypothetical protein